MDKFNDLCSAVNAIKQDVEDTQSKIDKVISILNTFSQFCVTCENLEGAEYSLADWQQIILNEADNIGDIDPEETNPGLTVYSDPIFTVKHWKEIGYMNAGLDYYVNITIKNESHTFRCHLMQDYDLAAYDLYKDGVILDKTEHFEDQMVGNFSVLCLITRVRESSVFNEFLTDLTASVKRPQTYNNVITKWANVTNISSDLKSTISDTITQVDGSANSVLLWLHQLYDQMKNTTYDSDTGELEFSSTDYSVKVGFASVGAIVISAIASAVAAVGLVIGKVAGAIAFAISGFINLISNAVSQRTNPTITMKADANVYNDFLPVPIAQVSSAWGSFTAVSTEEKVNFRINSPFASWRIFKNAGQTDTNYEVFLRCQPDPVIVCSKLADMVTLPGSYLMIYSELQTYPYSMGLLAEEGIMQQLIDNESTNGFNILDIGYENKQGAYVVLCLVLYIISHYECSSLPDEDPADATEWRYQWNLIKNGTDTAQTLSKFCWSYLFMLATMGKLNDAEKYWYTSDAVSEWYPNWNWQEVINTLLPYVRSKNIFEFNSNEYSMIEDASIGDFVSANDDLRSELNAVYLDNHTLFISDALQQSDSPFIVPKYTGKGAVFNLITSIVIIAATIALAVVATIAYKRKAQKYAQKRTHELTSLKGEYDDAMNDSSLTQEQKDAAYKKYIKKVRSYNRLSWLWGGGTWNAVNGWVDYASDPSSSSTLASSIVSTIDDKAVMTQEDSPELSNQNEAYTISTLDATSETVENVSTDISTLISLIRG